MNLTPLSIKAVISFAVSVFRKLDICLEETTSLGFRSMFPNLFEATNIYWRKLDELEASYQRGEVSLEEVDSRVAELIAELSRERRLALVNFWHILRYWFNTQGQSLVGLGILLLVTYGWVLVNSTS